jgi:hypothetical protein
VVVAVIVPARKRFLRAGRAISRPAKNLSQRPLPDKRVPKAARFSVVSFPVAVHGVQILLPTGISKPRAAPLFFCKNLLQGKSTLLPFALRFRPLGQMDSINRHDR